MVAVIVPNGIDLRGFFKSPESPTPAVIPVKAGKIIANTTKKSWLSFTFENISNDFGEVGEDPNKNIKIPCRPKD